MPWTLVTSLSDNATEFTTTFTGTDRTNTVSLGDRSTGDLVDIVCNFPTGTVNEWFQFNPRGIDNFKLVHVAIDDDANTATVRFRVTRNTIAFGSFNLTFNPSDENAPNYTVTMVHT